MRLAAALVMAWEGSPFMYYGEEIGMQGGAGGGDENKRTPMRWTADGPAVGFTTGTPWYAVPDEAAGVDVASQLKDPASLLHLYKNLIALRQAHPALRLGKQARLDVDAAKGVVVFERATPGERVLLVANLDRAPSEAFEAPVAGAPKVLLAEGLTGPVAASGGKLTIPALAPRAFAFIALGP